MPATKKPNSKTAVVKAAAAVALPKLFKTIVGTAATAEKVKAIAAAGGELASDKTAFKAAMAIVKDAKVSSKLRLQALDAAVQGQFNPTSFASVRGQFLNALRTMRGDDDPEMRQRVFGILAREQDRDTQEVLIAGLLDPVKASLPPEKALQLLSYDSHAGAFDAARRVLADPPNDLARQEAMRVLGADSQSAEMFENLLRDPAENIEIRQIAATALNHLDPARFLGAARDVAVKPQENEDMKAMCLTALSHFGDAQALKDDRELHECVNEMQTKAAEGSGSYKAAAKFKRSFG